MRTHIESSGYLGYSIQRRLYDYDAGARQSCVDDTTIRKFNWNLNYFFKIACRIFASLTGGVGDVELLFTHDRCLLFSEGVLMSVRYQRSFSAQPLFALVAASHCVPFHAKRVPHDEYSFAVLL